MRGDSQAPGMSSATGRLPRSLPTAQSNDQAIVVEIAPIRFPRAREVFRYDLGGVPGELSKPGLLDRPLIRGLAPLEVAEGDRRSGDKLCVAHVPVLLGRLVEHGAPVRRACEGLFRREPCLPRQEHTRGRERRRRVKRGPGRCGQPHRCPPGMSPHPDGNHPLPLMESGRECNGDGK